ncbi:hypothetical protein H0W91_03230 [Patescibacteria group bacterium]|nr:hypothetical protein [Patescibacteria group bacterium]
MLYSHNKLIKIFLSLGILAFLFVGFLGMSHFTINMEIGSKMSMVDCPCCAVGTSICTMTPVQHISMWQSLFTNIPSQNTTLILLLLASTIAFLFFWTKQLYSPPKNILRNSQYSSYQKYIPNAHNFQELFSQGILNPKLF